MKFRKPFWLISAATFSAILLSSCNLGATPMPTQDTGAVQTQAFNLVLTQAALQLTQTAMANPTTAPTNTPFPTATLGAIPTFAPIGSGGVTPLPGFTLLSTPVPTIGVFATVTTKNGCNDGLYLSDNGPADWDTLTAGTSYSVTFSIQNTGTCVWDDGYTFALNTELSSPEIKWEKTEIVIAKADEFTQPQHSQSFTVKFTAPKAAGKYEAYWKLRDDAKNYFGPQVWIKFVIK